MVPVKEETLADIRERLVRIETMIAELSKDAIDNVIDLKAIRESHVQGCIEVAKLKTRVATVSWLIGLVVTGLLGILANILF